MMLGTLTCWLLMAPAGAAEVCVICTGPDTTYRCAVQGAGKVERLPAAEQVLEFVCARKLAKSGGHAKCRARRDDAGGACVGQLKTISLAKIEKAVDKLLADPPKPRDGEGSKPSPKADPNAPPKSLEELARRSTQGSKPTPSPESAPAPAPPPEKAQEETGGSKKPWSCLTSLFKQC
jgi:hypothetical protein